MLSEKAAAWTPAKCEMAHGADPEALHPCGHVDRLAAEPGALQPQHADPTQAPSPELGPGRNLCKLQQVLAVGFLLPSAEQHLHGLLYGTPSDP